MEKINTDYTNDELEKNVTATKFLLRRKYENIKFKNLIFSSRSILSRKVHDNANRSGDSKCNEGLFSFLTDGVRVYNPLFKFTIFYQIKYNIINEMHFCIYLIFDKKHSLQSEKRGGRNSLRRRVNGRKIRCRRFRRRIRKQRSKTLEGGRK